MAFPRFAGSGVPLNLNNALGSVQVLQSQVLTSTGFTQAPGNNAVQIAAGEIIQIPAGTYMIATGPYTSIQYLDPVTTRWTTINADNSQMPHVIDSDGGNYRLANLTGCPVGAVVTTSGSGYTNGIGQTATGCTVTPSAGGSVWVPVVGGAVQLAASAGSVAPITAGSSYLFPPIAVISPPPAGGIQATGHCVMSGGGLVSGTGFVIDNQGAGYTAAPSCTLINDPRDSTGSGGAVTLSLNTTFSGTLTALYPSGALGTASGVGGYGLPQTSTPTFTFSPVSATATMIMNYTVTGTAIVVSGAGYQSGSANLIFGAPAVLSARASSDAGPIANTGMIQNRLMFGTIIAAAASGTFSSGYSQLLADAGFGYQAPPTIVILQGGTSLATTTAQFTATVGGTTDICWIQPI